MVTGEMVEELILSGADIIKVGIGPGKSNPVKKRVIYGNIHERIAQMEPVYNAAAACLSIRIPRLPQVNKVTIPLPIVELRNARAG